MKTPDRILGCALAGCVIFVSQGGAVVAGPVATTASNAKAHDGQHDFDYLVGAWKIHLKRRMRPLTGSNDWIEFDGTVVCRQVWNGHAEVEEFNVDSAQKNIHIHGLAVRLYNPASGQWSIYWANGKKMA